MQDEVKNQLRTLRRYNHVSISLRVLTGNNWEHIRATDWNKIGFNFCLDHEICESQLAFRKGTNQFFGDLVWSFQNDDDALILKVILNTLLIKHMKRFVRSKESIPNAVAMIRTRGHVEKKRKLLDALGLGISSEDEQSLILQYQRKHRSYRFGVRVDSEAWSDIVRQTLETASVLDTFDNMISICSEFGINCTDNA